MKRRRDTGKWEVRWRENGRNRSKSFTVKADAVGFDAQVRRARESDRPLDLDRGCETLAEFVGVFWRQYAMVELAERRGLTIAGCGSATFALASADTGCVT